MKGKYYFYKQLGQMDCGPTCLRMVTSYYGKRIKLETLRDLCEVSKNGVSLYGIADAAEKLGIHTAGKKLQIKDLAELPLPCILHWNQNHFVVLYKAKKNRYKIADPANGMFDYSAQDLKDKWMKGTNYGIALLLDPGPEFFERENESSGKSGFGYILKYLKRYRSLLAQLICSFMIGSFLQILLPFLTQSIVDTGINTQDIGFINLVLIAQFFLLVGKTTVEFIRSWILLHISTRLNIFVLTDFLSRLMKLPISFFDTKKTGDILQRIEDQKRIETFLTGQSLNITFSLLTLLALLIVLALYSIRIFILFLIGTTLYTIWILAFLKRRKMLDNKRFEISAKNQSTLIQMVNGMQDIKIAGVEKRKRWDWEDIQAKLFRFNVKSLALGQYQQGGGMFFNEGKNLLIIYFVAVGVMNGEFSLGSMIAIQYILGQLNSPVEQFLAFVQGYQDAKLSLNRMNEVYMQEAEENNNRIYNQILPTFEKITFNNVTYSYPGNLPLFENLNLSIPKGKTTAIVGMSGSGKTTLIKLLLAFYKIQIGDIKIGDVPLDSISPSKWRNSCGVVMQDSFIFSDTVAANITLGDEIPDIIKLNRAIKLACLEDFLTKLPLGLNTMIGLEGSGISQGQKQRILIARAIYKEPDILLFDEATNSLDAQNEKLIVENLDEFFKSRTVVVVAHRLSTVKNADNIIVLENGKIAEEGTHKELIAKKDKYFQLVSNQLELDRQ